MAFTNTAQGVTSWKTITAPDAVQLLLNVDTRRFLEPFMLQPRSVKSLADEVGLPLNAVHHRILRLEQAGLLRVSHLEPRRGRAVKHYVATAQGFFVPFTATTTTDLEAFAAQQITPLYTQFTRMFVRSASSLVRNVEEVGFLLYESNGIVNMNLSPRGYDFDLPEGLLAPDAPAIMASFTTMHLSNDEAKALQHEMMALFTKYLGRDGTHRYVVNFGMAPNDEP
jgi:DNA-binding Lrp family transcriptional regulator